MCMNLIKPLITISKSYVQESERGGYKKEVMYTPGTIREKYQCIECVFNTVTGYILKCTLKSHISEYILGSDKRLFEMVVIKGLRNQP